MFHCYLCSNHTWGNNSQILEKIMMGLGKAIQRNNRKQKEGRRYSLDFKANKSIFCPLEEDGGRQEKKGEANICCFCWHRCLSPIFTFSPSCSPQKWPTLHAALSLQQLQQQAWLSKLCHRHNGQ